MLLKLNKSQHTFTQVFSGDHVADYCPAVVYNDVVDMYYILISCHRSHHPFLPI